MGQRTDICDYFSNIRIYNYIIVSQEHYVVDKECRRPINVNNVDKGMKLLVYTWFSYQSSDRCTEVNDITLLDSWVISAQENFNKNSDLLPGKFSKILKGCPMQRVVKSHWDFSTN